MFDSIIARYKVIVGSDRNIANTDHSFNNFLKIKNFNRFKSISRTFKVNSAGLKTSPDI